MFAPKKTEEKKEKTTYRQPHRQVMWRLVHSLLTAGGTLLSTTSLLALALQLGRIDPLELAMFQGKCAAKSCVNCEPMWTLAIFMGWRVQSSDTSNYTYAMQRFESKTLLAVEKRPIPSGWSVGSGDSAEEPRFISGCIAVEIITKEPKAGACWSTPLGLLPLVK